MSPHIRNSSVPYDEVGGHWCIRKREGERSQLNYIQLQPTANPTYSGLNKKGSLCFSTLQQVWWTQVIWWLTSAISNQALPAFLLSILTQRPLSSWPQNSCSPSLETTFQVGTRGRGLKVKGKSPESRQLSLFSFKELSLGPPRKACVSLSQMGDP